MGPQTDAKCLLESAFYKKLPKNLWRNMGKVYFSTWLYLKKQQLELMCINKQITSLYLY